MATTVYIAEMQIIKGKGDSYKPKFDLTPAEEFGTPVVVVTPPGFERPEEAMQKIQEKMCHFRPTDYILPVGSPIVNGMVLAAAIFYCNTDIQVLEWSGALKKYRVTVIPRPMSRLLLNGT